MRRGRIILLFVLFSLVSTGLVLAGSGSLSPIDVGVTVQDNGFPRITILTPQNTSYNNATPLLVNYTIIEPTLDSIWYSLNSQPNITITGPFSLSFAEGSYNLKIYANDSINRINSSEVSFFMNASLAPFCGDTICNFPTEDCSVCPTDCGSCPPSPPGGGGGGGGGSISLAKFTIDKEIFEINLNVGEVKTEFFTIKNTDRRTINFEISTTEKLRTLTLIRQKEITLRPDEEQIITIDFIAPETTTPDLYVGGIIIEGNDVEKEIFVAMEIQSKGSLFDVKVSIPPQFQIVYPGEEILANIDIIDVGQVGIVDIELVTTIKDSEGEISVEKRETLSVDKQLNLVKIMKLPLGIQPGKYVFYTQVNYEGKSAISSHIFEIKKKFPFNINTIIPIIIFLIIAILYFQNTKIIKKRIRSKEHDL